MKHLLIILTILFGLTTLPSSAQSKRSGRVAGKTAVTKSKKGSSKGGRQSAASGRVTASGRRVFEGTLLYASYECHSKAVRSASFGMAYNGERNTRVTVRRDRIKISDETTHVHTLICPAKKELVLYSDLTNEGVALDYNRDFPLYFDKYSLDNKYWKLNYKDNGNVVYGGDKCRKVSSQLISKTSNDYTNSSGYIEYWESDAFGVGPVYSNVLYGAPVKGIVKKWILVTDMSAFLASFRSVVASELVAVNEHKVGDSELLCPAQVTIKRNATNSDLIKFYKANNKAMKKNKIKPRNADSNEIVNNINQEWPFVADWNNNLSQQNQEAWNNFGNALLTEASKRIEASARKKQEEQAAQMETAQVYDDYSGSYSGSSVGGTGDKSGMIVCESCHGSLVCSKCHGTGKKSVVYGTTSRRGKVSVKNGSEKCPICFGKKVCPICKGVGYYKSPYTGCSSAKHKADRKKNEARVAEIKKKRRDFENGEKAWRSYETYSGMVGSVKAGNQEMDSKEVKRWQKQMKEIREKHPENVPESPNETWNQEK